MKVTQKCALKVDLHLFWKKMDPLERKDSGTFLSSVSRRVFALYIVTNTLKPLEIKKEAINT